MSDTTTPKAKRLRYGQRHGCGSSRPACLLVGYYGGGNLGDELILSSLIGFLRSPPLGASVVVSSLNPPYTRRVHKVDEVVPAFRRHPLAWLRALRSADVLVLGGGGLIEEKNLTLYALQVILATVWRRPVWLISVGISTLKSPIARAIARGMFMRAAVLSVRDRRSLRIAQELAPGRDVMHLPDPAFAIAPTHVQRHPRHHRLLLALRQVPWSRLDTTHLCSALRAFLLRHRAVIEFLICDNSTAADLDLARHIAESLEIPLRVVAFDDDLGQPIDAIAEARVLVGMRLHSLLLASGLGVPFVAISYERKCDDLCQDLDWPYVMPANAIDPAHLLDYLETVWSQPALSRALRDAAQAYAAVWMPNSLQGGNPSAQFCELRWTPPRLAALKLLATTPLGLILRWKHRRRNLRGGLRGNSRRA